ncbi:MAG TPA: cell envelope integrity protein TolA [Rhodoblastus sp.]|nr:cell envelope integrity protein TolA [Rhodoblastus sp.]
MRFSRSQPGFWVSTAIHLGLLAFLLVHFSREQKFEDATEAVPVETITESQFHEIMQGEKTAPKATKPRAEKVADLTETKPTPPTTEAKRDVPVPPPPLKRLPDPGEADTSAPSPPTPPPRPAPPPPPVAKTPPAPPKPPEREREPEKDDAEVVKPKPPPRPPEKPQEKAEEKPVAKPPPKPPERPSPKPEPKAAEKPAPKPPKLDEVAKLLRDAKDKTEKANEKPAARPRSGDETSPRRSVDLGEIAKLLNREAPESKFSTGHEVSRTASLGARHASGAKMSPSMADSLGALLQEQYKQCWNYLPLSGDKYIARIRVSYLPDGSLAGQPVLLNPPSNPAFRSLAESALRAVRRCNPLRIPAQYQPYYDQWKDWVVGFDPEILN